MSDLPPASLVLAYHRVGVRSTECSGDGYADKGNVAAPLLRDGLPVTFSVVARGLHEHGELWWDRLEHLVFETTDTPDPLVLDIMPTHHSPARPTGSSPPTR